MIKAPDSIIFLLILSVGIYYAYYYHKKNLKQANLTYIISIIMSSLGILKAIELIINIIFNSSLDVGQLRDSKILIIIGGFSIIWVGTTSCITRFKNITNE